MLKGLYSSALVAGSLLMPLTDVNAATAGKATLLAQSSPGSTARTQDSRFVAARPSGCSFVFPGTPQMRGTKFWQWSDSSMLVMFTQSDGWATALGDDDQTLISLARGLVEQHKILGYNVVNQGGRRAMFVESISPEGNHSIMKIAVSGNYSCAFLVIAPLGQTLNRAYYMDLIRRLDANFVTP